MANDMSGRTTTAATKTADEKTTSEKAETFEYNDNDLVTVLYRYGDVPADYKQLLGSIRFVGGVAQGVPGHVARQLQNGTRTVVKEDGGEITRRAYFKANNLYVLPDNASAVDYARYAKIKVDNNKVAALLGAADIAEIAKLLGEQGTNELISKLIEQRNRNEQKRG